MRFSVCNSFNIRGRHDLAWRSSLVDLKEKIEIGGSCDAERAGRLSITLSRQGPSVAKHHPPRKKKRGGLRSFRCHLELGLRLYMAIEGWCGWKFTIWHSSWRYLYICFQQVLLSFKIRVQGYNSASIDLSDPLHYCRMKLMLATDLLWRLLVHVVNFVN